MARSCRALLLIVAVVSVAMMGPIAAEAPAQELEGLKYELVSKSRPGGYLSLLKIGLVALVFIMWVKLADWINLDAQKFRKKSGMEAEAWNPVLVLSFLISFVAVISVPFFWATYPVYVLAALLPPMFYYSSRRRRMKDDASFARMVAKSKGGSIEVDEEPLPQDEGAVVNFTAAGSDKNQKQGNLIRARQSPAFATLKELIFDFQFKRGEQLLLDFTANAVGVRILVDGVWHNLEPMDRQTGDNLLMSLKCLADVNPMERRAQQSGTFSIRSDHGKNTIDFTSQGVQTGERALLKVRVGTQEIMTLEQLGMFPDMLKTVTESMNTPGMTIISAPPGHGMTSSWQGALISSDRLTRDCISLVRADEVETRVENVVPKEYDPADPGSQQQALQRVVLTQPDMLVVPTVEDSQTMDLLVEQANSQDRAIMFRTNAQSAAEALLRIYSQSGDRAAFLKATKVVTCQRLMRRLCPTCRVPAQVQPQFIQQLGGDPKKQNTIFNQYQLPPPEQRVDENGQPIEFPPCETCGGIGYIGRIAVFEVIVLNDQLRQVIRTNPTPADIEKAAVQMGKRTLAQQAYQLVLLGVTSLAEVQRILKAR